MVCVVKSHIANKSDNFGGLIVLERQALLDEFGNRVNHVVTCVGHDCRIIVNDTEVGQGPNLPRVWI